MTKGAVFLDRDGVINKSDRKPPNRPEELVLLPRVAEAVRDLKQAGHKVFVVTNQGGVGLGYMTSKALDEIHARLTAEVEKVGAAFDEIVSCTHKPKAGCECRKPKPGMLITLANKYKLDLASSYMVGDREVDIQAGKAAGTKTIFIGKDSLEPEGVDYVAGNLWEASRWILSND